jgi:hypothetical protein
LGSVSFDDALTHPIDRAIAQGFVVWVLSPDALESEFVTLEMRLALERQTAAGVNSRIVAVVIRDFTATLDRLTSVLPAHDLDVFDLTRDRDHTVADFVRALKSRPMT